MLAAVDLLRDALQLWVVDLVLAWHVRDFSLTFHILIRILLIIQMDVW